MYRPLLPREIAGRSMARLTHSTQMKAFSGWLNYVSEVHREREIVQAVLELPRTSLRRRTWRVWADAYAARRRLRKAARSIMFGTATRVIRHWKVRTVEEALYRTGVPLICNPKIA